VRPTPGASKRTLKVLDRQAGSRLQDGRTRNTDKAIIFLAEFEQVWKPPDFGPAKQMTAQNLRQRIDKLIAEDVDRAH